jgi:antitoxin (DNA-binding transcriptional repressor) of toxin-antitoxin stability system
MKRLNIHEAKTHLSRHLAQLEQGERIVLCKRNVPIAVIIPLPRSAREVAPFGLWKGQIEVPDSFFEPLPEELLTAFEGRESRE